jgi:heat shock protein HslJ
LIRQRRTLWVIVFGAATVALGGCAADAGAGRTTEPGALVGTWVLEKIFPNAPEQPFVSFLQDNTWSSSDGCNRVRGTWDLRPDGALTTTAGPQTLMECEGAQLPLSVIRASGVHVEGDSMVIYSSYDSTTTELVRSSDPLVGPHGLPVGYWVESRTPNAPFLSIAADGTFSGNDGCNVLTGKWAALNDESTEFTDVATTRMACENVDQWLSRLALGRVVAGVMTLQSADGTVIGQLEGLRR